MACGVVNAYHDTRFAADARRDVLWATLWRAYFRKRVSVDACVLDLGAGYGQFINNVVARRRIAVDVWPGLQSRVAPGVEAIVGDVSDLSAVESGVVDYAFASNLFEHLTQERLAATLGELRRALAPAGVLTVIQPNYAYAFREYFDDYTHVSVWTHVSLADFFRANGFEPDEIRPKFLPLTLKSRLPVNPLLIEAYLASPWKPLGKQMLLSARPLR